MFAGCLTFQTVGVILSIVRQKNFRATPGFPGVGLDLTSNRLARLKPSSRTPPEQVGLFISHYYARSPMETCKVIKIECEEVICDACNEDYTERGDTGGAISHSWAYCPSCWKNVLREHGTPKFRTIINNPLTPFAAFVKAIRSKSAV